MTTNELLREFIDWSNRSEPKRNQISKIRGNIFLAQHRPEFKKTNIPHINQQSEQLKNLVGTDEDVVLPNGDYGRLLKYTEESFLVEINRNKYKQWFGVSKIKLKKQTNK